jgi:hypothetical protein
MFESVKELFENLIKHIKIKCQSTCCNSTITYEIEPQFIEHTLEKSQDVLTSITTIASASIASIEAIAVIAPIASIEAIPNETK